MNNFVYDIDAIGFSYRLGKQQVQAIESLSLKIDAGDVVCISGPSGSGKTTLLNLMGLIEQPSSGRLLLAGEDLGTLTEARKNEIRLRQLGFIFQNFNLLPTLNAFENVEYFLVRQGVPKAERRSKVEMALAAVGLADQARKRPMEMSGGQRQRVSIARALAKSPAVILADEPTASLDQKTGHSLIETLLSLNQSFGLSVIIASHDPMVMSMARRNVRMRDGRLEEGTV